jgi:hypothetical protein
MRITITKKAQKNGNNKKAVQAKELKEVPTIKQKQNVRNVLLLEHVMFLSFPHISPRS